MDEQRKETDSRKELTDAELLELGKSFFQQDVLKKELEALHVSPGWIAFIKGLRVINIIAGVLLLIIGGFFITATGPGAIGLIVFLGPMLLVTVVYWINIIASVIFILKYKPKGTLLYLSLGVLLVSSGVLYIIYNPLF